jgi:uncharacterized membrane protein
MFRTTLAGGILFLIPIILIILLLGKALSFAKQLSNPLVEAAGVTSVAGIALGTLLAILFLVLVSFAAGFIARTRLGQMTLSRMENSILSLIPHWRMAKGLVASFETDSQSEMDVVLVPTDAGWCIALVLEKPDGDWWSVFVPGAPHWTSGMVAFAHRDQVKPCGLSAAEAILLMRRCGSGSAKIRQLLSSLEGQGSL